MKMSIIRGAIATLATIAMLLAPACDGGGGGGEPGVDTPTPGADSTDPGEDTVGPGEDTIGPGEDTIGPGEDTVEPGEDTVGPGQDISEDSDPGCVPNCEVHECGHGGCPDQPDACGTCAEGSHCKAGMCKPDLCVPDCGGKTCGDDGCGGSCGECSCGEVCADGACVFHGCDGKVCGDDGCGGSCGQCGCGEACQDGGCVFTACDGKVCGPDGCGGWCGDQPCGPGFFCEDGACVEGACMPQCVQKQCGDNGCGGSCGTCPPAKPYCVNDKCKAFCPPQCQGKSCGFDDCGNPCGTCAPGQECVDFQCVGCTPQCGDMTCGDDGCGGNCGTCGCGETCEAGQCAFHGCDDMSCGADGCGGSCGSCEQGWSCDDGACIEDACLPACGGKDCGDDGCGGSCGSCSQGWTCNDGVCEEDPCVPACGDNVCGSDGCGGNCGNCAQDLVCIEGACATAGFPDSGQTACYNAFGEVPCPAPGANEAGQDGAYSINPMSFTDFGDGTVADNVTGLVWQKCAAGLSGADCGTGTMDGMTWQEAIDHCAALPPEGTWKLPGLVELLTIVDYSLTGPMVDPAVFPGTDWNFWTSNPSLGASGYAYYIGFGVLAGKITAMSQTLTVGRVRCVQGDLPHAQLEGNGDGTVTDAGTGLTWTQCLAGTTPPDCAGNVDGMTWAEALAWCEDLDYAGHDDWRLPNTKEIWSIMDFGTSLVGFLAAFTEQAAGTSGKVWTSSTYAPDVEHAWNADPMDQTHEDLAKYVTGYGVRCVRGP